MRVREVRLPGLGMRYELELGDGRGLFVVAERSGRREVGLDSEGGTPEWQVTLDRDQAVMLASLLLGARFTVDTTDDQTTAGDQVVVDTVDLPETSRAIGLSAAEITFVESDVAVLAVISDETPEVVEDVSTYRCRPGDRIVVAARGHHIDAALASLREPRA